MARQPHFGFETWMNLGVVCLLLMLLGNRPRGRIQCHGIMNNVWPSGILTLRKSLCLIQYLALSSVAGQNKIKNTVCARRTVRNYVKSREPLLFLQNIISTSNRIKRPKSCFHSSCIGCKYIVLLDCCRDNIF